MIFYATNRGKKTQLAMDGPNGMNLYKFFPIRAKS